MVDRPGILVVTNMYPTPGRPILGTFVAEQVDALRRGGCFDVDVLFIDGPSSRLNYVRGFSAFRRAWRTGCYQLVHAHYVFSAMIALTQRRLPVVVTHHGIEAQVGWTAPLCRLTSRLAARTIATSPRVAQALGLAGIVVLPCGVDTDLFTPLPKVAACERLGLPVDRPRVLFVGSPRPEKRLPLIRAAVACLQEQMPGVSLLAVHDEPRERIPLYMNACDVLVLASVAEGSPMVVREAMACNLPIVSTDVGDVRALTEGMAGHFIAAPEPGDLADKLRQALQFGHRTDARQRILSWSLDAVAGRIGDLYREVLDGIGAGVPASPAGRPS